LETLGTGLKLRLYYHSDLPGVKRFVGP